MKAQMTILVTCFVIIMFGNFGTAVDISSKVDLDSDENEEVLSNTAFHTIANLNKSTNPSESVLRTPELSAFNWHRGSELVKSSEPRKRRIYASQDGLAGQPKVINNIQIVINNNDSISTTNSCKDGICNVSVSSKLDGKGNIVTDVHLSIITSLKLDTKIDDIPVIESFRGIDDDHYKRPIVNSINIPNSVRSYLYHDNTPQIQTTYQNFVEPWYQYRRAFQQPRIYRGYHYLGDTRNVGFQRFNKIWLQNRPIIDDKIEPPLSKTSTRDMR